MSAEWTSVGLSVLVKSDMGREWDVGGSRLYGGGSKSDTAGRVANDEVIAFDGAEVSSGV